MNTKKINEFPDGSGTLSGDDIFLIMDNPASSGVTKNVSVDVVKSNFISSLESDLTTVSGIVDGVSGVLRTDLTTVSGIAGVLRTDLITVSGIVDGVSGVLRTDLTTVSGIVDGVSGVLRTDLTTVSGIAGVLRTDLITVSGIVDGVSGVLRTDIVLISGTYAPLNSPALTGVPTAPTAPSGTNTNQIATTNFVRTEVSNLVASAPSTLDTLNELAIALDNDPNFAITITNNLASKANLSGATFTGNISGPSGDFINLKQDGIVVSTSGHTHISTNITDFVSATSGVIEDTLTTSIIGQSGVSVVYNPVNDTLVISSSGLDTSYISNFNSTVYGIVNEASGALRTDLTTVSGIVDEVSGVLRTDLTTVSGIAGVLRTDLITVSGIVDGVSGVLRTDLTTVSGIAGVLRTDLTTVSGIAGVLRTDLISVSGLVPTISNSANNRILTSTGTSTGINSEANLTFDGNLLRVSGNLIAISGTYNQLAFNTSLPDPDLSKGQLQWNNSEGTLDLGFTDTYSQHVGEELHYRVRNNTPSTLTKGTSVYASGLTPGGNNRIEVAPFTANGSVREVRFMGLVTEDIAAGVNGYTTQFGYIRGIDTRGDAASNGYAGKLWDAGEPSWSEGDILYAHPTVAGKLTKVEPKHSISVAIILNRHQNQGKIFVRPTSYGHLGDNHDVSVSGATNGQFLQYNSATDYWVPSSSGNFSSLSVNGTGVSVSGHTHASSQITDFNLSVSGLLPRVSGSGINRVIISDGTNLNLKATPRLTIDDSNRIISSNGNRLLHRYDRLHPLSVAGSGYALQSLIAPSGIEQVNINDGLPNKNINNSSFVSVIRNNFQNNIIYTSIGTSTEYHIPSGVHSSGALYGIDTFTVRNTRASNFGTGWFDDSGTLEALEGIRINYGHWVGQTVDGIPPPVSVSPITNRAIGLYIVPLKGKGVIDSAYDIFLQSQTFADGTINNHYGIFQESNSPNIFNGSITINDGLSAPTKIFSLGTVGGNVSVSYGIDKQIQTLTLNGTTTNFIKGSWPTGSVSVDVLLEITVTNTTTVSFALVDDWYNPVPSFTTGKYLVLLRSIGSTIQGHYIGNKTN